VLRKRALAWIGAGLTLAATAATAITVLPPAPRSEVPASLPDATAAVTPLPAESRAEAARHAALLAAVARLGPAEAEALHDIRIHRFGPADQLAVCGRVRSGSASDPDLSFVARVLLPPELPNEADRRARSAPIMVILEEGPGIPRIHGSPMRRAYCREAPAMPPVAAPRGPAPSGLVTASLATAAATGAEAGTAAAEGGGPALAEAVVRSGANMRDGPSGRATILRVAQRGESFQVFDQAPGGWIEVGADGQAFGWIHSSLLEMR